MVDEIYITSFCFGRRRFFITATVYQRSVQVAKIEEKKPIVEEIKNYVQQAKP